MLYVLAILLPFLAMMLAGHMMQGVICLILQITVIGWPIAAIWALLVVHESHGHRLAH